MTQQEKLTLVNVYSETALKAESERLYKAGSYHDTQRFCGGAAEGRAKAAHDRAWAAITWCDVRGITYTTAQEAIAAQDKSNVRYTA